MTGLIFLLPGVFFALVLRYYPMAYGIFMSFFKWSVVDPPGEFVGLKNFISIFNQQFFWDSWKITFSFLFLILGLTFWVPIVQALSLDQMRSHKMRNFFSTVYLIPTVIPISATVVIWKWIWNRDYGFANLLLSKIGIEGINWLADPSFVRFSIIFPQIVAGGLTVLLYLAALYSVPQEQYDAARIDGASALGVLWHIKLPNIRFIIQVQLIYTIMNALQLLDLPYQMTQGGPNRLAMTVPIYIFKSFHEEHRLGKASAASFILFIVIAIFTLIQLKLNKEQD